MKVAILGASANPERYAYLALKLLEEKGHEVFPVNPTLMEIEGRKVYPSLAALPAAVHTVTLYLGKDRSDKVASGILASGAKRLLFNPGAENPELMAEARKKGIACLEACTLVLLRTNQFDRLT
jgi:uncharacterized protein